MNSRATQAAVVLYGLLHLAGWRWPAQLWGVDQLHYYDSAVGLALAAMAAVVFVAGHSCCVARPVT